MNLELIEGFKKLGFKKLENTDAFELRSGIDFFQLVPMYNTTGKFSHWLLIHFRKYSILGEPNHAYRVGDIRNPSIEEAEYFIKKAFSSPNLAAEILHNLKSRVDLTNKTSTQRIEELESQVEVLNTKLQKIEDMVKDKSLKLDELEKKINHNQSLQSIEKIMEVFKEIQQLAITLKAQNKFPLGGVTGNRLVKVEGNENILTRSQVDNLDKEPKFKIGDEVVIVCKPNENWATELLDAIEASSVHRISSINRDESATDPIGVDINGRVYVFEPNELQHAPKKNKELKLGGWAEVVGNTSKHGFKIGQKVLVGCFYEDIGQYVCLCKKNIWYCNIQDLKPL